MLNVFITYVDGMDILTRGYVDREVEKKIVGKWVVR